MFILHWLFWVAIIMAISPALTKCSVNRIIVRVPNPMDIGLIFDITIVNTESDRREMLEFRIRSDGTCCLNMTNNRVMSGAGRVVGGNFGYIEAGKSETVSLIWPTISLYNRLGSCPILIVSTNANNKEVHLKQLLIFDTRFTTLDPDGHTFRKNKNFKDCKNWDKDYLKNCTPVDCEERYFGKYSFYNTTSQQCEPVVACSEPHELYDAYNNECIDSENFCDDEDIQQIKQGKYREEFVSPKKCDPLEPNVVINNLHEDSFLKAERLAESQNKHSVPKRQTELNGEDNPSSMMPYWLQGIADGLLIVGVMIFFQVFATIAIYVLICFIIFLIVSWISRRHFNSTGSRNKLVVRTPASSDNVSNIYTPSSLLSQR